jgi:hypothetical protein
MSTGMVKFQERVHKWCVACFGPAITRDRKERCFRFLEEAVELVQSMGMTKEQVLTLVNYVYGRPAGIPRQEVGGTMVTLAALCGAHGLKLQECAQEEINRIESAEVMQKIRMKQISKGERIRGSARMGSEALP